MGVGKGKHLRLPEGRLPRNEQGQADVDSHRQAEEGGESFTVKICTPDRGMPFLFQQGWIAATKGG